MGKKIGVKLSQCAFYETCGNERLKLSNCKVTGCSNLCCDDCLFGWFSDRRCGACLKSERELERKARENAITEYYKGTTVLHYCAHNTDRTFDASKYEGYGAYHACANACRTGRFSDRTSSCAGR